MNVSSVAVHGRRLTSRLESDNSAVVSTRRQIERTNDLPTGRIEMVFIHLMDGEAETTLSVGFNADGTFSVNYGEAQVQVREGRLWIDSDFGEVFIR